MTESDIEIIIYKGLEGFKKLENDWLKLAKKSATHFLHFPAWYGAELLNCPDSNNAYFVSLTDSKGDLLAVLPFQWTLFRIKYFNIPIVQLFYPNEMGVNDIISDMPLTNYKLKIAKSLRNEIPFFLFIRWQCIPENGNAISLDTKSLYRHTHDSMYLNFKDGFTEFLERYSKKFRKDITKKIQKIENLGNLELKIFQEKHEIDSAFDQFLMIEDSGWKGKAGTSIIKQPSKLDYYKYLKKQFSILDLCRINLLTLNDKPIAAQFGIAINDRLYLLKIGFSEEYSEFSPGFLLIYKLIEYFSHNKSINRICFVTGVEWIKRWHPDAVNVGHFYSSNGTILSKLVVKILYCALRIRDKIIINKKPQTIFKHEE